MIDVKRAVSADHTVAFTHYFNSCLWYQTAFEEAFPVPIEDIGNATFKTSDKAAYFMRYMRKHNEQLEGA